ncbi:MAG: helix-turn-helix transcriptional regulator [Chitinophagaceae bacterium]|nr:helix-turn-helix transcriptional regulator [Chitinophagaceae bacterium]
MDCNGFGGENKFIDIFHLANTTRNTLCPVRDIIGRISDKWSMLAIYALGGFGKMRFNALKHKIGDISQRMLTVTLRNLEHDGLISRKVYAEVPPRVEYELTALGYSLLQQLALFADWANNNSAAILQARTRMLAKEADFNKRPNEEVGSLLIEQV